MNRAALAEGILARVKSHHLVMADPRHALFSFETQAETERFHDSMHELTKSPAYRDNPPMVPYAYDRHVALHFENRALGEAVYNALVESEADGRDGIITPLGKNNVLIARKRGLIALHNRAIETNNAGIERLKEKREDLAKGHPSLEARHYQALKAEEVAAIRANKYGRKLLIGGAIAGAVLSPLGILGLFGMATVPAGMIQLAASNAIFKEHNKELNKHYSAGVHAEWGVYQLVAKRRYTEDQRRAIVNEAIGFLRRQNERHRETIAELKAGSEKKSGR